MCTRLRHRSRAQVHLGPPAGVAPGQQRGGDDASPASAPGRPATASRKRLWGAFDDDAPLAVAAAAASASRPAPRIVGAWGGLSRALAQPQPLVHAAAVPPLSEPPHPAAHARYPPMTTSAATVIDLTREDDGLQAHAALVPPTATGHLRLSRESPLLRISRRPEQQQQHLLPPPPPPPPALPWAAVALPPPPPAAHAPLPSAMAALHAWAHAPPHGDPDPHHGGTWHHLPAAAAYPRLPPPAAAAPDLRPGPRPHHAHPGGADAPGPLDWLFPSSPWEDASPPEQRRHAPPPAGVVLLNGSPRQAAHRAAPPHLSDAARAARHAAAAAAAAAPFLPPLRPAPAAEREALAPAPSEHLPPPPQSSAAHPPSETAPWRDWQSQFARRRAAAAQGAAQAGAPEPAWRLQGPADDAGDGVSPRWDPPSARDEVSVLYHLHIFSAVG